MLWNPQVIVELLQECANFALGIQDKAEQNTKIDGTIVTEADKALENLIINRLTSQAKGSTTPYFIGEETISEQSAEYMHSALRGSTFVIDPIDGTLLYAQGLPSWGISIGFMEEGEFKEGAILLPESGELLISSQNEVMYARNRIGNCPKFSELELLVLPNISDTTVHSPLSTLIAVNQAVIKKGKYRGKLTVLSTGSCVSSIIYLAQHKILGYITHSKLWDLAAGLAILSKLEIFGHSLQSGLKFGRGLGQDLRAEDWIIETNNPGEYLMLRSPQLLCQRSAFEAICQDFRP